MFVLCHETGQLELAVKYGQQVVAQNPWDFEYWGRLAHVLGQLGRLPESVEAAEKALELNPAELRIHAWLEGAYLELGQPEKSAQHKKILEQLSK
jgi:tetratricopeptide (TPR) repeat protein